jgi:very-short-patch-repair endonuclease
MHPEAQRRSADREIGRIAEGQHGVVTKAQLSELGLGDGAIKHRVKLGRLRPVYRGVYTIGHTLLTRNGRWMAAVLACGPRAVLSYRAAAALWGIRGGSPIEITVPGAKRARPDMRLHRAELPADEITLRYGIPTTTVPRTLLDLSAVVQRDELRSAMRKAEQLRLTDALWLGDLIDRYRGKPGIPILRAVVEEARSGLSVVRSELEERFQAFLLNAGLPLPKTNVLIEGVEVDCAWPAERLIVELDGRTIHDVTDAFESDRARDRRLEAQGWHVIRVTWRQLHGTPGDVEADLRRLLGLSPRRGPARASPGRFRTPSGIPPAPSSGRSPR